MGCTRYILIYLEVTLGDDKAGLNDLSALNNSCTVLSLGLLAVLANTGLHVTK